MAKIDFEKLHAIYAANMTGGMYDWLSQRLGVSVKALQELEVGWVPIVQFAKTKSFDGWFTFPMRDAAGKVVGLSLRNRNDSKVSYPGTKPGCFYVVNPDHADGNRGYSAGSHNWVRTMDAHRLCPVCGKPDGCLISNENVSDPKAVICRVKKSNRALKFGYLHILKSEGVLANARLLAGEGEVAVVEGASDIAALIDLEIVGVGRPSNVSGLDIVADLVRGRDTIIIGENDENSKGEWPGRDGAVATLQTLKRVVRNVRMAMPPTGIKDLRAWKVRHGLTREALIGYFETHGTERVDNLVIQDSKPLTVVRAFLKDLFHTDKRNLLRMWGDNFYLYDAASGKYAVTKDTEIIAKFYRWSADKQYQEIKTSGPELEPLVVSTTTWNNAKQAALADLLISTPPPSWVNDAHGPDATNLIVFNNGILNVPAFLSGSDDYLQDTTPDFFNTTALPIPFDPTAECPVWKAFINSSLGDDPVKIDLLQEWLGYCMTPDTSMQKFMYLRGVTGSGKSRVMEVLQSLVGKAQSATTTFASLANEFGLGPLVGKLTCLIWDARTPRGTDGMRGLEVMLNLSGSDSVSVNRKFKEQLEGTQLTARVTIASNYFIDVPDYAGAMERRLNVIEFKRSFRDKPDTDLPAKLAVEIPGIAVWALEGLRRLRQNGEFTIPPSSREAMNDWKVSTNPIVSFCMECLEPEDGGFVTRQEVHDMWRKWSLHKTGLQNITASHLIQQVLAACPYCVSDAQDVGGGKTLGYLGMRVEPYAARQHLGRP